MFCCFWVNFPGNLEHKIYIPPWSFPAFGRACVTLLGDILCDFPATFWTENVVSESIFQTVWATTFSAYGRVEGGRFKYDISFCRPEVGGIFWQFSGKFCDQNKMRLFSLDLLLSSWWLFPNVYLHLLQLT